MGTEIEILKATSMGAAAAAAAVGGGWGATSAKRCDSCKTAAFCRADSAFLCDPCDGRIHFGNTNTNSSTNTDNKLVPRVLMCEVCEQAPAAVTCKADAAALCVACDLDIHSANPVAQRHERVPIEPIFVGSVSGEVGYSSGFGVVVPAGNDGVGGRCEYDHVADGISWMLPGGIVGGGGGGLIPQLNQKLGGQGKCSGDQFFSGGEMDALLGFEYGDPFEGKFQQSYYSCGSDGVVPVQSKPLPPALQLPAATTMGGHQILVTGRENELEFDFCRSKLSPFSYPTQSSLSNSVSSSSHDAGIVPDGSSNSMSEISFSFDQPNIPISSAPAAPANPTNHHHQQQAPAQQLCGLDRVARVMRYREKRKNRKFEKTIRYASRKAYAETRPRIKGRFAKRSSSSSETNMESDFESSSSLYGSAVSAASLSFLNNFDSPFDLVPSFR